MNGKKLGKHIGGFTPFNYELTGKLNPTGNFVIIKVDNKRSLEQVPTVNTDWWNCGGITRDVMIIEEAATFVEGYYIQLAKGDKSTIEISVKLNGASKADQTIDIAIPEAKLSTSLKTYNEGVAKGIIKVKKLEYWSSENPKWYKVDLKYAENTLTDKIGFRTLEVKGADIL